MRPVLLSCLLLLAVAAAASDEPVDLRRALPGGAVMNWTRLQLEATASALGSGVATRPEATEQLARRRIGPAMLDGSRGITLRTGLTVGDLDEPELAAMLRNRVTQWEVAEATYHASGRVQLVGLLAVDGYLRPWLYGVAPPRPPSPTTTAYTGLVVDARGTGVQPAFCPSLLDGAGASLWDGLVWREAVLETPPVVWVGDPAHPAVARAGAEPLVVRAVRARGSDLVLADDDAAALRRHLVGSAALHGGSVVVVVDP
jgi:hypothetical protein